MAVHKSVAVAVPEDPAGDGELEELAGGVWDGWASRRNIGAIGAALHAPLPVCCDLDRPVLAWRPVRGCVLYHICPCEHPFNSLKYC